MNSLVTLWERFQSRGMRTVALFEAGKGAIVLAGGCGLLTLLHRDVHAIAVELIAALHLNPAKRYPRIFLDAATHVTDARLWALAGLALVYAVGRGCEAWGLWHERAWAEWLALVTGGIYLPFEVYELSQGATWVKTATLLVNLAIVAWMGWSLWQRQKARVRGEPEK